MCISHRDLSKGVCADIDHHQMSKDPTMSPIRPFCHYLSFLVTSYMYSTNKVSYLDGCLSRRTQVWHTRFFTIPKLFPCQKIEVMATIYHGSALLEILLILLQNFGAYAKSTALPPQKRTEAKNSRTFN